MSTDMCGGIRAAPQATWKISASGRMLIFGPGATSDWLVGPEVVRMTEAEIISWHQLGRPAQHNLETVGLAALLVSGLTVFAIALLVFISTPIVRSGYWAQGMFGAVAILLLAMLGTRWWARRYFHARNEQIKRDSESMRMEMLLRRGLHSIKLSEVVMPQDVTLGTRCVIVPEGVDNSDDYARLCA